MEKSVPRLVLIAIYIAFVCKGLFYSAVIPIWEGYDEYAHFAFIQHVAVHHELPLPDTRISREVERSLELVPLPWELRDLPPPHVVHDSFWMLTPEQRTSRERDLLAIPEDWSSQPGTTLLYEGKQGPLYYWLMWPLYDLIRNMTIPDRVWIFRFANVLLASLLVPITFAAAKTVLPDVASAIAVCALVASMPELYMDAFRVGNQSLAMILYSLFTLFCLKSMERDSIYMPLAGITLGLLLITRAYGLAAIPAMLLVVIYTASRQTAYGRTRVYSLNAAALASTVLIASWWYIRNLRLTGTLIWYDSAPSQSIGLASIARHALNVHWLTASQSVFGSHIWFGNWSFLSVRSWMYQVFQFVTVIAVAGLVILLRKKMNSRTPKFAVLGFIYGAFLLSIGYHVLMNSINSGVDASAGWYLYSVIAAEAILVVAGLLAFRSGKAMIVGLLGCFLLLEVYAMHFLLIPYYTGLIAHAPDGGLRSFHLSQLNTIPLAEILSRLEINRPFFGHSGLIVLWFLFIAAAIALPYISARSFSGNK